MDFNDLSRSKVRAFVQKNHEELKEISLRGGNPHQRALDQQDDLEVMISSWPDESREKFMAMYIEELNAVTAQTEHETQELLRQADQQVADSAAVGQIIGAIVGVAVLIFIFAKLF